MLNIPILEKLVHELGHLPGVGAKSAERMAYHILRSPKERAQKLAEALMQTHAQVTECPSCFNYTDEAECRYCKDPHRQNDIVCVIEEPSDIIRIEASGAFKGRYHVLHGTIAPLEGVGPEDIKAQELLRKVSPQLSDTQSENPIREIILALDADLEGDTTTLYLAKLLEPTQIKITRIAHGVPIGGNIDFIDNRTMSKALENRVEV